MRFEEVVQLQAPPAEVWAVMSNVAGWPQWNDSVTAVEVLRPGPVGLGTQARVKQPRLPAVTWEVTDWRPATSFTWEVKRVPVPTMGRHAIAPSADGSSTVTLVLKQKGPLAPLLGALTRGMTERYIALEAQGLKRRCEAR